MNLRSDDQIDEATFARKQTELRDRVASIKLQLDAVDRPRDETADLAMNVLNCRLVDATLKENRQAPQ